MGFASQLRLYLAVTLAVLGLSAGARLVLGPAGFAHYHELGHARHAHSHVHAGPHRHDLGSGDAHHHPPTPQPERDDDAPAGRYVPAAGPVAADSIVVVQSDGAPQLAGFFTPAADAGPRRQRADSADSPRGPPA
jgi:hypothetical protein